MNEYMDILGNLGLDILKNPITLGLALGAAKKAWAVFSKDVDKSDVAKKAEPWLHPVLLVLSGVVTAGNLLLQGHLSSLDPNTIQAFIQNLVQTFIGAKAVGTKTIEKAVDKIKNGNK